MNQNVKLILLLILIFLIFIFFILIRNKIVNQSEDMNSAYSYNEVTNEFIIYDENGNIRATTKDEDLKNLYIENKDYDESMLPPGFVTEKNNEKVIQAQEDSK